MSLVLFLLACSPETAEDKAAAELQLEAATISSEACPDPESCDGIDVATGTLAATRSDGASSVDLTLTIDETDFAIHSPTGIDLSDFVGTEITASIRGEWMMPTSLELHDAQGLVYVVESGAGNVFSAIDVQYGETLGQIVDEDDYQRIFHALEVSTDDGVVSVKPGEVVTIHINNVSYRFGAIAAYEIDTIPNGEYTDCGGESPILSYELVRITEEKTWPALVRPAGLEMALYSGCGE